MGWARGSGLLSEIISVLQANVSDFQDREDIYRELIGIFEGYDCDTIDECLGDDEAFDKAWEQLYTNEDEEKEDFEDE